MFRQCQGTLLKTPASVEHKPPEWRLGRAQRRQYGSQFVTHRFDWR